MKAGVYAWLAAAVLAGAALPAAAQTPTPEPTAAQPRPRIGLVLSGGGARGFAHLGVLRVLHELRVPIDCIAGTSMGALVGGSVAAGMSIDELILRIGAIDWDDMLVDAVPRPLLPERVRRNEARNLFDFQLGLRDGDLLLPTGTSSGYKLTLFLRTLLERAGNFHDENFDRLPLPFRAVATNLENGEARVFDRGDLVQVLRASMSVPGAFAPAEIDGTLYVDGGLVDNLPIDVARRSCADVVIAVNLGSPLLKRAELNSIIGVGLQTINLLTEQNVRASLASLEPTDILIEPALGDFSAANFAAALAHTLPIGEAAARAQAARLQALALPPQEYAQWSKQLRTRLPKVPEVTGVEARTTPGLVNPQVIESELRNVPGIDLRVRKETRFEPTTLAQRLTEVYGRGDFDSIGYWMDDRPGGRIALVDGLEKAWGPNYLKFGLALSRDDFQSTFDAALQYRMTWLTRSGTEWRNFLQVGYDTVAATELYQPLSFREGAFTALRASYDKQPSLFFNDGLYIGQYDVTTLRATLDFGVQNRYGEVRAGAFGGRVDAKSEFGILTLFGFPSQTGNQFGYALSGTYDQLDSANFPRHGTRLWLRSVGTYGGGDTTDPYNRTEGGATFVRSSGPHSLQLSAYGGVALQGTLPLYDLFELGGLLRGSGFNFQELTGQHLYTARTVYTYQYATLPPQLGRGLYFGGSLEVTRARTGVSGPNSAPLFWPSASVFFGADTIIGPLWLAWGQTLYPDSRGMWYLQLGTR